MARPTRAMSPPEGRLPNITVTQLEYLEAVGATPTWSEAASQLGVTISALSQGLAELERRVGLPLFERQGRRRRPTPAAEVVRTHAATVLASTRDVARWARATRQGHDGGLRVGMIDAAAIHHFPDALARFRSERPDVDLRLRVAPSGALLDELSRAELDIVVCVDPGDDDRLDRRALLEEELHVYAPGDLVARPPHDRPGPWVTFPEGSHTRAIIAAALAARGDDFEVVAESNQPEVLREMVRVGMGWSVLPTWVVAQADPGPPLRAEATPLAVRPLVAVRRAGALYHPGAEALFEVLATATAGTDQ
ncbi:MAG: LysR family transcriptional regulator [Acidimicrobiia bacterium]|nr:LysR family transcriptional regulator [Acidimicrobiia bacterium]